MTDQKSDTQDRAPLLEDEDADMRTLSAAEAAGMSPREAMERLGVERKVGLTSRELERRRAAVGYNELTIHEERPLWRKYIEQV